ncbi:MAG: CIA30 family protein [Bacteroidia bacterium]|nr:CIA30 family protein [Bacteroidia bacterium]
MIIFQFNDESDISQWTIVDDVVMGGRSNGKFIQTSDGFGQFYGKVSLENNGGFSSVRYPLNNIDAANFTTFKIKVKGDGKMYQFRVKSNNQRHSYVFSFTTTKEWQEVIIPFNEMTPSFRGNQLNIPNYDGGSLTEMAFLIGNKKEQSFKLLIEEIAVF